MDLNSFSFPVTERLIAVDNNKHTLMDLNDPTSYLQSGFKAIAREDTNECISVVKNTYKVVRNSDLIDKLLRELATCGTGFKIDPSHSFVDNSRMRLQITFPGITLNDRESKIALSAFLHNSYDQSEGIRFYFGAIRHICSNGMVFGDVLTKYYARHTSGFRFEKLSEKLDEASEYMPVIQNRINRLEDSPVTEALALKVSEQISKRLADQVLQEHEIGRLSQWKLYNRLTNYVSHQLEPRHQTRYQQNISKVFQL